LICDSVPAVFYVPELLSEFCLEFMTSLPKMQMWGKKCEGSKWRQCN